MKTLDLKIGQEVYVWQMCTVCKGKIEEIYETAISVSIEDGNGHIDRLMTYHWSLSLDEILQDFIQHTNEKFNTQYTIK